MVARHLIMVDGEFEPTISIFSALHL